MKAWEIEAMGKLLKRVVRKAGIDKPFEEFSKSNFEKLRYKIDQEFSRRRVEKENRNKDEKVPIPSWGWLKERKYIIEGREGYENKDTNEDLLDTLCFYINEKGWHYFKKPFQKAEEDLPEPVRPVIPRGWRSVEAAVVKYYTDQRDFQFIHLVGDVTGAFNDLSMADYYHNLAYLSFENRNKTNTLLIKEKEHPARKIQTESMRISGKMSAQVVMESNRLIILGNPGTGKSVYSRRLCYEWAQEGYKRKEIIIHITLKKLHFEPHDNALITYMAEEMGIDEKAGTIITKYPQKFLFLLDGFDELQATQKDLLFEHLFRLSLSARFVLFTRPYGILNQSIAHNSVLEILGFNDEDRLKYLLSIMEHKVNGEEIFEGVMKLIQQNPVISDLSYNPLSLSYIVVLANGPNGIKALEQVQSAYDIQHQLMSWVKSYYEKKPNYAAEQFLDLYQKAGSFAQAMELDQQYIYHGNAMDVFDHSAAFLNEMGIARKEPTHVPGDWRFYFFTTTSQEYMATAALLDKITVLAFEQLLANEIYWNLSRMLIGGLVTAKNRKLLDSIFQSLSNKEETSGSRYFQYHYLILLGETDRGTVNQVFSPAFNEKMFSLLEQSHSQSVWTNIILDAIKRIFAKLDQVNSTQFLEGLAKFIFIIEEGKDHSIKMVLADEIVNYFQLYKDPSFLSKVMDGLADIVRLYHVIEKKLEEYIEANPEADYFDTPEEVQIMRSHTEDLYMVIESCLEYFTQVSDDHLLLFWEEIEELESYLNNLSEVYIRARAARHGNDYVLNDFTQYMKEVNTKYEQGYFNEDPEDEDGVKLNELYDAIQWIGQQVGVIAKLFQDASHTEKEHVERQIMKAFPLSQNLAKMVGSGDPGYGVEPYASALNILRNSDFVEKVLDFAAKQGLAHFLKIKKNEVIELERKTLELLSLFEANLEDEMLRRKLESLFYRSQYAFLLSARCREKLFAILKGALKVHGSQLDKGTKKHLKEKNLPFLKNPVNKALSIIPAMQQFGHDRQYMINRTVEDPVVMKYDFVRYFWLPNLMVHGGSIHKAEHWHYIRSLIKEDRFVLALDLLDDLHTTYEYASNLPEVKETTRLLLKRLELCLEEKPDFRLPFEKTYLLARYIFHLGRLLIRLNDYSNNHSLKIKALQLLRLPWFIPYILEYLEDEGTNDWYLLGPLFIYHLTQDHKLVETLQLPRLYAGLNSADDRFMEVLMETLDYDTLSQYEQVVGPELLNRAYQYHSDNSMYFRPFDKQEFLTRLNEV